MTLTPRDPRHGTENGYNNLGCRCPRCTRAHADYYWLHQYAHTPERAAIRQRNYRLARKAGYSAVEATRRSHWGDPLRPSP